MLLGKTSIVVQVRGRRKTWLAILVSMVNGQQAAHRPSRSHAGF